MMKKTLYFRWSFCFRLMSLMRLGIYGFPVDSGWLLHSARNQSLHWDCFAVLEVFHELYSLKYTHVSKSHGYLQPEKCNISAQLTKWWRNELKCSILSAEQNRDVQDVQPPRQLFKALFCTYSSCFEIVDFHALMRDRTACIVSVLIKNWYINREAEAFVLTLSFLILQIYGQAKFHYC